MLIVVIALITGEEQYVGIDGLDVGDDVLAPAADLVRVTREGCDDDLVLVDRVTPDQSLENRATRVSHAIREVPCLVPALDAERGQPTGLIDPGRPNPPPFTAVVDLQLHLP